MLKKISGEVNAINWFDIPTVDLERAKKFYETVLNIKMEMPPLEKGEGMAFFPRQKNTVMGLSGILSGALVKDKKIKPGKNGPVIYLNASPSIGKAVEKVEAAGGKILTPVTKIPAGLIAVILDTEGNRIGLHAAK